MIVTLIFLLITSPPASRLRQTSPCMQKSIDIKISNQLEAYGIMTTLCMQLGPTSKMVWLDLILSMIKKLRSSYLLANTTWSYLLPHLMPIFIQINSRMNQSTQISIAEIILRKETLRTLSLLQKLLFNFSETRLIELDF